MFNKIKKVNLYKMKIIKVMNKITKFKKQKD